jgi:hypothetical protein
MREQTFFKYMSQQHYLSWLVLLYSVISSAMIPPWLMSIKANKLLRISWRSLLQLLILFPFVLFEWRSANEEVMKKYTLENVFKPNHIKKIFLLSFTGAFWVSTILTDIEWTYISHSMVLGALTNFFLSIERTLKSTNGQLERGGQLMIVIGIVMVIYDSVTLDVSKAGEFEWNVYNPFYLTREWWQRVLADLVSIPLSVGSNCDRLLYEPTVKANLRPQVVLPSIPLNVPQQYFHLHFRHLFRFLLQWHHL